MPWYCSTGGQPGPEGWTQEMSSCVLQVSHRRSQQKPSRAGSTVLSQPCPWGVEIMEAIWASGLLGLAEEPVWGYALRGETLPRTLPFLCSLWGTDRQHLASLNPLKGRTLATQCWAPQLLLPHTVLSQGLGFHHQQHPRSQRELVIHLCTGWPHLGCVGDTHRCTDAPSHVCLLTPKGLNSMLQKRSEGHVFQEMGMILLSSYQATRSWARAQGSGQTLHLTVQWARCPGLKCWGMNIWCLPLSTRTLNMGVVGLRVADP